jgi:hypothetical protein
MLEQPRRPHPTSPCFQGLYRLRSHRPRTATERVLASILEIVPARGRPETKPSSSLPKSPCPRPSPQGTPEALLSPILRCLSSTSASPAARAMPCCGHRTRRGQDVAATLLAGLLLQQGKNLC